MRVRTRGAKLFVQIEFVIAEREFVGVAVFRISPLKRLNKRAIKIADSHGGDSLVWLQDR